MGQRIWYWFLFEDKKAGQIVIEAQFTFMNLQQKRRHIFITRRVNPFVEEQYKAFCAS